MVRLFVTGDVHNSKDIGKLSTEIFTEQKELTKEDILIVCGDFGLPWTIGESKKDKYWLDWLQDKTFTTMFVDGNHENFDALEQYPEVVKKGALCHKLRDSVYHIKRGEVLHINNKNIFCFGGATSIDKLHRKEFINWWKQEEPSFSEISYGIDNLLKMDRVDIIFTHEVPYSVLESIEEIKLMPHASYTVNKVLDSFYNIAKDKDLTSWYFGHHHIDGKYEHQKVEFQGVYQNIIEIE